MSRLLTAVAALGLGSWLFVGCSGTTFSEDTSGNAGGSSRGGQTSGGGNDNAGMSSDAGSPSGGTNSDGGTSAGTASGGQSTAGSSVGGSAGSGGSASGGSASGGTGGASSGGTSNDTCRQDSDCEQCVYYKAPTVVTDCYCTNCSWKPLTKTECDRNRAAFEKVCSKTPIPCPAIACQQPRAAICEQGVCASGSAP